MIGASLSPGAAAPDIIEAEADMVEDMVEVIPVVDMPAAADVYTRR